MLSLLATPSPVPIIINMPETGAPWWGVPAITASAVLFGALIAFLSARANDERKAKRDKAERIMIDTRTVGLEYLDAVNTLADLMYLQLVPASRQNHDEYANAVRSATLTARFHLRKFELVAPDDALAAIGDLSVTCEMLVIEAFGFEGIIVNLLHDFELNKNRFMNILRLSSGVGEIAFSPPSLEASERFDARHKRRQEALAKILAEKQSGRTKKH